MSFKKKPSSTQYVMGKNTIQSLLETEPKRIIALYTCKDESDPLLQKAFVQQITIKRVTKKELFQIVQSESHQSYVAQVRRKEPIELRDFLERQEDKERSLLLALDSIYDPQNLGTLLRAAACFGVDGVFWSKNRGTDITPVVTKASVGASEMISTMQVSNLAESIKLCQKNGYTAITAEINPNAESVFSFSFPEKTLLIMGSEGEGVQPLVSKIADKHLYIPITSIIDSLNVSQATSILLYEWQKQFSS